MKGVIIQGSSRSKGDTRIAVDYLQSATGFDFVDLLDKDISAYDYTHANRGDDFIPLMEQLTSDYDLFLFATPVYWYSMSGLLKNFFDRITDCLKIEKEIGRRLRGKHMGMLSCSNDPWRIDGFELPFSASAKYLGMNYLGDVHAVVEGSTLTIDTQEKLDQFVKLLLL
ncbi:MAG: NAD(P)H-dependent oxidoreductase [Chitinophagales bacterium]|nr:NAD(P)H-dependent oxidoreductase [Chitinophagales bacterium]